MNMSLKDIRERFPSDMDLDTNDTYNKSSTIIISAWV